jgi:hypothetical protein
LYLLDAFTLVTEEETIDLCPNRWYGMCGTLRWQTKHTS